MQTVDVLIQTINVWIQTVIVEQWAVTITGEEVELKT